MESFPFSQSVKERSVIKLHLCHRRLRCLPMHPILFRCISVLALPHGMAVQGICLFGFNILSSSASPVCNLTIAYFQFRFLHRNVVGVGGGSRERRG